MDARREQPNLQEIEKIISEISPVSASYYRNGEKPTLNPAYCDIEHSLPLCLHEKRIWALRSDMILATGIKNKWAEKGNTSLYSVIDSLWHHHIDTNNYYGHPSLTLKEKNYDGSAYYAGWVCQREDHLQIYLSTGRFHQANLTNEQISALELYISHKFMQTYGRQNIIFIDYVEGKDYEDLFSFLQENFAPQTSQRIYTPEDLAVILSEAKDLQPMFRSRT